MPNCHNYRAVQTYSDDRIPDLRSRFGGWPEAELRRAFQEQSEFAGPLRNDETSRFSERRTNMNSFDPCVDGIPSSRRSPCRPFDCCCYPCPGPWTPPSPPLPPPPPCPTAHLLGLQAQLVTGTSVDNNSPVLFNSLINDKSDNINYSSGSGNFIFTKPGNYYVSWSVAISLTTPAVVRFGIQVGGSVVSSVSAYISRGQLTGSALITITDTPVTVQLINLTGSTVTYDAASPVLANIVFVEVG